METGEVSSVARGGSVYVRYSASGTEELGTFRTDADTSDAAVLPGAKFTGQTSGDLAVVELNQP